MYGFVRARLDARPAACAAAHSDLRDVEHGNGRGRAHLRTRPTGHACLRIDHGNGLRPGCILHRLERGRLTGAARTGHQPDALTPTASALAASTSASAATSHATATHPAALLTAALSLSHAAPLAALLSTLSLVHAHGVVPFEFW